MFQTTHENSFGLLLQVALLAAVGSRHATAVGATTRVFVYIEKSIPVELYYHTRSMILVKQ